MGVRTSVQLNFCPKASLQWDTQSHQNRPNRPTDLNSEEFKVWRKEWAADRVCVCQCAFPLYSANPHPDWTETSQVRSSLIGWPTQSQAWLTSDFSNMACCYWSDGLLLGWKSIKLPVKSVKEEGLFHSPSSRYINRFPFLLQEKLKWPIPSFLRWNPQIHCLRSFLISCLIWDGVRREVYDLLWPLKGTAGSSIYFLYESQLLSIPEICLLCSSESCKTKCDLETSLWMSESWVFTVFECIKSLIWMHWSYTKTMSFYRRVKYSKLSNQHSVDNLRDLY